VDAGIDVSRGELEAKIDAARSELCGKIDKLDAKIESVKDALVKAKIRALLLLAVALTVWLFLALARGFKWI
jgi:hypothetical protein